MEPASKQELIKLAVKILLKITMNLCSITLNNYSSSLHIFRFMGDDTYKYVNQRCYFGGK